MESTIERNMKCTVMEGMGMAGSSVGQENIMQLADDRLLPSSLGSFVAALERFVVESGDERTSR